jgi:hypothetical protein
MTRNPRRIKRQTKHVSHEFGLELALDDATYLFLQDQIKELPVDLLLPMIPKSARFKALFSALIIIQPCCTAARFT